MYSFMNLKKYINNDKGRDCWELTFSIDVENRRGYYSTHESRIGVYHPGRVLRHCQRRRVDHVIIDYLLCPNELSLVISEFCDGSDSRSRRSIKGGEGCHYSGTCACDKLSDVAHIFIIAHFSAKIADPLHEAKGS